MHVIKVNNIEEYEDACALLRNQGYIWTGNAKSPMDTKLVSYEQSRPYLYVNSDKEDNYPGEVYISHDIRDNYAYSLDRYKSETDPTYFGLESALKIIYDD